MGVGASQQGGTQAGTEIDHAVHAKHAWAGFVAPIWPSILSLAFIALPGEIRENGRQPVSPGRGGLRQEVLYYFGGTWPTGPSAMAFCVLQRLPLMIGPWASGGIGGIVRGILQHRIQWHGPRSTAKHRPQEGGQWTVDWSVPRGWT